MIKTGFKNAFTLAEVLTTLMVIGVVAAMTIPTLLNSTDDQQYKVGFKKGVSVLSQAAQLNIAKGEECNISDAKGLCDCFANSMAGTCTTATAAADGNGAYSTLTTPDGIAYMFVLRGTHADDKSTSFDAVCGSTAPNNEATWKGEGATCVAMIDVNGLSKGNKKMYSSGVTASSTTAVNAVITAKDQFPVIITAAGVYPVITDYQKKYGHVGYDYMYGAGSSVPTPWHVSSYFSNAD
jgi:prepilin-type N-terminal cleavage/methylation domain-containing protein